MLHTTPSKMTIHNQNNQNASGQDQVVVVMVPFPAQGHLNQLLQLSRLVSSYNIPVHYVGTTTHNRQARLRVQGWNPNSTTNIHFHDLQTPSFLSPLPDPNAVIKFPSHLQPAFDSLSHLRDPLASLLRKISSTSRRIIVIHDSMMSYVVQEVTSVPNAESYAFHSVSAFAIFLFFWEVAGKPFTITGKVPEHIPPVEGCFSTEFVEFINTQHKYLKFTSGHIYNACKEIEGPFIDLLAREDIIGRKKQWALGPFNPVSSNKNSNNSHKLCLEWLEKQDRNSVLFVSFGTTISLTDEQIKEIAIGLEKSDQKFIWVLRDADKGDVFGGGGERKIELPKRYEEKVREKGIVVREWAPQLEILGHSSTGGFMSHCGWNSCMESITMGVPIATWPMHSDQPRNAVLINKLLKIGVVVKDWDKRDELVRSVAIEKAIKRLMDSKEGDEMRKRAAELGGAVRQSVEEGGSSRVELDSFITHITR